MLALLNSQRIQLPANQKLVNQLTSLERRTSRGGKDLIDHPPGAHDDLANAVAGVASTVIASPGFNYEIWNRAYGGGTTDDLEAWRRLRTAAYLMSGGRTILW